MSNFDLKEEIRWYWSRRAASYDMSAGHKIQTERELKAYARALLRAVPDLPTARVLELACGTGEFTSVLRSLGCSVRATDFSEAMIDRASSKHADDTGSEFALADAEATGEPAAAYDAVVCRNLVWTLASPSVAFEDWHRILRPGGALVVLDGDWFGDGLIARVARLGRRLGRRKAQDGVDGHTDYGDLAPRLPFSEGLPPSRLAGLLKEAGFTDVRRFGLTPVAFAQLLGASWRDRSSLLPHLGRSFLIAARKAAA